MTRKRAVVSLAIVAAILLASVSVTRGNRSESPKSNTAQRGKVSGPSPSDEAHRQLSTVSLEDGQGLPRRKFDSLSSGEALGLVTYDELSSISEAFPPGSSGEPVPETFNHPVQRKLASLARMLGGRYYELMNDHNVADAVEYRHLLTIVHVARMTLRTDDDLWMFVRNEVLSSPRAHEVLQLPGAHEILQAGK